MGQEPVEADGAVEVATVVAAGLVALTANAAFTIAKVDAAALEARQGVQSRRG